MAKNVSELISLYVLFLSATAMSCPTCMSADGEAVRGLFWSMLALFLTVLSVLSGLACYFCFLRNQAIAYSSKELKTHHLNEDEGE